MFSINLSIELAVIYEKSKMFTIFKTEMQKNSNILFFRKEKFSKKKIQLIQELRLSR